MLPKYIIDNCYEFSINQYESSKDQYIKRNQKKENIINAIFKGKVTEWYVYQLLRSQSKPCIKPDMQILNKYNKSYDADLISGNYRIHVKSCTEKTAKYFGMGWVFQKEEIKKYNNQDIFALCLYKTPTDIIVVKWLNSSQAIYKDLSVDNKPSKCAIMYNKIKSL